MSQQSPIAIGDSSDETRITPSRNTPDRIFAVLFPVRLSASSLSYSKVGGACERCISAGHALCSEKSSPFTQGTVWLFATRSSGKKNVQLTQQSLLCRVIRLNSLNIEIDSVRAGANLDHFATRETAKSMGGK